MLRPRADAPGAVTSIHSGTCMLEVGCGEPHPPGTHPRTFLVMPSSLRAHNEGAVPPCVLQRRPPRLRLYIDTSGHLPPRCRLFLAGLNPTCSTRGLHPGIPATMGGRRICVFVTLWDFFIMYNGGITAIMLHITASLGYLLLPDCSLTCQD